jgi:hypothetical protein
MLLVFFPRDILTICVPAYCCFQLFVECLSSHFCVMLLGDFNATNSIFVSLTLAVSELLICVINRLYTYEFAGRLLSIDYNTRSTKKSMGNYSRLPNIQQIPCRFAVAIWIISRLWPLFRILREHGLLASVYDIPQCGYTPLKHHKYL